MRSIRGRRGTGCTSSPARPSRCCCAGKGRSSGCPAIGVTAVWLPVGSPRLGPPGRRAHSARAAADSVPMTDEILAVIGRLSFRVAKTMPQIPHQYTVRQEAAAEADYVALHRAIREDGVIE